MHRNFWHDWFRLLRLENPDHQMALTALGVQFRLLLVGEVPRNIQPLRITRGNEDAASAVSFRQFASGWNWRRSDRLRCERVAYSRTTDGRTRGQIAFEQQGGNFYVRTQ